MPAEQIAVRLPEEQIALLDDLVNRGEYQSRAAAVRAGVECSSWRDVAKLIEPSSRATRTQPPSGAEQPAAFASMREAIAEEPW